MHLDHKIPWQMVAVNFNLPRVDYRTPSTFISRGRSSQTNDLNHFVRVFLSTIFEFSRTERAKYPKDMLKAPFPDKEKLFSDAVLEWPKRAYGLGPYQPHAAPLNTPLGPDHQRLDYWITRAGTSRRDSDDGHLADAIKMLLTISAAAEAECYETEEGESRNIGREAMSALLRLAAHPEVCLHRLEKIGGYVPYGFNLLPETTLNVYLIMNVFEAIKARQTSTASTSSQSERATYADSERRQLPLMVMQDFRAFVSGITGRDFDAQGIAHMSFWKQYGDSGWMSPYNGHLVWSEQGKIEKTPQPEILRNPVLPWEGIGPDQYQHLKSYLKFCFSVLYRYNLLMTWSRSDDALENWWKDQIIHLMASWAGCHTDYSEFLDEKCS